MLLPNANGRYTAWALYSRIKVASAYLGLLGVVVRAMKGTVRLNLINF